MKKYLIFLGIICTAAFVFSNCHTPKKAMTSTTTTTPKVTYATDIRTIVETNCTPCHIPSRGGNKKALDTYDSIKANIDEVIRRVSLNPTDRGFMPFKKPKLSDSTIAVLKQWHDAGTPE